MRSSLARIDEPLTTLGDLRGGTVVIDEVQRRPELFPLQQVLADHPQYSCWHQTISKRVNLIASM